MSALYTIVWIVLGTALAVLTVYDLGISLAGIRRPGRTPPASRARRFAVLIAAHDEEAVIGRCVGSLRDQNYPDPLYRIFVVADRCSDRTAEVARRSGAVAIERREGQGPPGKAPALRHLIDEIADRGIDFDAVCVFDADNVASPDFLRVMNRHLESGERCVQGYLDVKNPQDSWISGSIAIGYWTTNRLWQLARYRLGLSCALGGTGFCLEADLARRLAWRSNCLTDDLDLQMTLIQNGERVCWAHEARTYDEKPVALVDSWRQRLRWVRGHWDVARRCFVPLLVRALRTRDVVALDAAIYALQPLRTVVAACTLLAAGGAVVAGHASPPFFWAFGALAAAYLAYVSQFCFLGLPGLGLALERIPLRHWRFYPGAFLFGLTWIPICLWGLLTSRRSEWFHTVHERALSIEDCWRHQDAVRGAASRVARERAFEASPLVAQGGR